MHGRAQGPWSVMPEHCPLEEHFLLPAHEIAYEAAQVGVLEKAQIDRGRV